MVRDLSDDPLRRACRSPLHRLLLSLGTNQIKTMHIKLSSKQLDSVTLGTLDKTVAMAGPRASTMNVLPSFADHQA